MTDKVRVAAVFCDSYDEEKVYSALKEGIDSLGGIGRFVSKDENILVKPNFLSASDPEKAVITHPSVIKAMLRILSEEGYPMVCCGDSPGHGSPHAALARAGLSDIVSEFGVYEADMSTEMSFDFADGLTSDHFYFTKAAFEADAVINLCKMKTHALERITGAVKNVYGLICGYRKAQGHVKYPNDNVFARMLCDIHRARNICLNVMDGITAMEGNGPGSVIPAAMNILLISDDPVAVDAVFCRLVNLDPELVPTNVQGKAMGIGTYYDDEIEIVSGGEIVSLDRLCLKFGNAGFDVDRTGRKKTFLSGFSKFMTGLARKPYIDKKKCIGCGICESHCPLPEKAIVFRNGRGKAPSYDYSRCIRCYCCQEMCPEKAIKVRGRYD